MSKRHDQGGRPRHTVPMLPPRLDDYVGEDNPVRAIDSFVDALDLNTLVFGPTETWSEAGQPPFNSGVISHNKPSRNPVFYQINSTLIF